MLKCNFKKYVVVTFIFVLVVVALSFILRSTEQKVTLLMLSQAVLFMMSGIHIIILVIRLFHDGPSEKSAFLNSIIFIAPFDRLTILMLVIMFAVFDIALVIIGNFIV